jgi:hypothetical protein
MIYNNLLHVRPITLGVLTQNISMLLVIVSSDIRYNVFLLITELKSNGSTRTNMPMPTCSLFCPLLSTAGMVLFIFHVFLVGLANTSSLFVLLLPAFAPANNGGLLSFSPSEYSPSSSCPPSLSSDEFSPSLPL